MCMILISLMCCCLGSSPHVPLARPSNPHAPTVTAIRRAKPAERVEQPLPVRGESSDDEDEDCVITGSKSSLRAIESDLGVDDIIANFGSVQIERLEYQPPTTRTPSPPPTPVIKAETPVVPVAKPVPAGAAGVPPVAHVAAPTAVPKPADPYSRPIIKKKQPTTVAPTPTPLPSTRPPSTSSTSSSKNSSASSSSAPLTGAARFFPDPPAAPTAQTNRPATAKPTPTPTTTTNQTTTIPTHVGGVPLPRLNANTLDKNRQYEQR